MITDSLQAFHPITLAQMDSVSLMKRQDTKFVLRMDFLTELLYQISEYYQILEIGDNRFMTYNSTYFDTPQKLFYHSHHNKIAHRTKVRVRNYVESEIAFLEIKLKNNKGITTKKRIKIDPNYGPLNTEQKAFIEKTIGNKLLLTPTISNSFNRFTLVNLARNERVTIDANIAYNGCTYDQNLAILELKQEKLDRTSPVFQVLSAHGIRPFSISKYCIGLSEHNADLKQNYFKHKKLLINKITS